MRKSADRSALSLVLAALVPYSDENLLLTFRPAQFFNELEKASGRKGSVLRTSFYRGVENGYITSRKTPQLTVKAHHKLQPYTASKLKGDVYFMVIFDVPESRAAVRRQFRYLLRRLEFIQIQKSVWVSQYDHHQTIRTAVKELGLFDCVQLYESASLPGS